MSGFCMCHFQIEESVVNARSWFQSAIGFWFDKSFCFVIDSIKYQSSLSNSTAAWRNFLWICDTSTMSNARCLRYFIYWGWWITSCISLGHSSPSKTRGRTATRITNEIQPLGDNGGNICAAVKAYLHALPLFFIVGAFRQHNSKGYLWFTDFRWSVQCQCTSIWIAVRSEEERSNYAHFLQWMI